MLNESISMGKRALVDSIWKSAGIEGLGTTFPDIERILDNLPVMTTKDTVLFIVNMKRAWEFLFDNIDYPISLSFLREVNKICMDGIVYNAGEIRKVTVGIGGTDWKPEMPHEGTIIADIDSIMGMKDPLEKALSMFCYIARTQMFLDGNKRVAQLICNKILMADDMGIFSVPYGEIDKFKRLLVHFYETNDNTEFMTFLRDECLQLSQKGCSIHKQDVIEPISIFTSK